MLELSVSWKKLRLYSSEEFLLYSNNAEFFLRPSEGFPHERERSYLDQDSYITSTILLRALVS